MGKLPYLQTVTVELHRLSLRSLELSYTNAVLYRWRAVFEDINLTQEEFYEKLKQDADISTSQPSIGEMQDAFDELLKEYDELVYIPMSSGLSGTCQTATMVADDYDGKGSGCQ